MANYFKLIGVGIMNLRAMTRAYRLRKWSDVLSDRAASGLSVKDYCAARRLNRNAYFYWQRKLREAACEHLSEQGAETGLQVVSVVGFAEVGLADEGSLMGLPSPAPAAAISVEVGGVRISTDSTYPVVQLAAMLRELVKPC